MNTQDRIEFLTKYSISETDFANSGLSWKVLTQIYDDYLSIMDDLEVHAEHIAKSISKNLNSSIHSTKYRIKNPEHLIVKIIKKKLQDPDRNICFENYKQEITDLIGVRVLHLFKDEWEKVHEYITNNWELQEPFTANIRQGDKAGKFEEKYGLIKVHPAGYRSVHYLISFQVQKKAVIAEIQVRTIFEEAWSEIDHKVRYPNHTDNEMLSEYLVVFNRLAGSADEMGTFLNLLVRTLNDMEQNHKQELSHRDEEIGDLQQQICKLTDQIAGLRISTKKKEAISAIISEIDKRANLVNTLSGNTWGYIANRALAANMNFDGLSEKALQDIAKIDSEEQTAVERALQDTAKIATQKKEEDNNA